MSKDYSPCLLARFLLWALPHKIQWRMSNTPSDVLTPRLINIVHTCELIWVVMIFTMVGQFVRVAMLHTSGISLIGWMLGILAMSVLGYVVSCWALGFVPPMGYGARIEREVGYLSSKENKKSRRLSFDLLVAWLGKENLSRFEHEVMRKDTVQVQGVKTPSRRL